MISGGRMTKITRFFILIVSIAASRAVVLSGLAQETGRIVIENKGFLEINKTDIDAGPSYGDILNNHYFPGLECFKHGYFSRAKAELDYLIARPDYVKSNPRQAEFMTNSHYIRGMIYLYHASGLGRHVLAKRDFEQAIRWNPKNYLAHLELSRVWAAVGKKEQAASVLRRLLALGPDEATTQQAKKELSLLGSVEAQR
jgi:tetratricopeptide (TPR) repeat protein